MSKNVTLWHLVGVFILTIIVLGFWAPGSHDHHESIGADQLPTTFSGFQSLAYEIDGAEGFDNQGYMVVEEPRYIPTTGLQKVVVKGLKDNSIRKAFIVDGRDIPVGSCVDLMIIRYWEDGRGEDREFNSFLIVKKNDEEVEWPDFLPSIVK
jgi:hypothetical protein